MGKNQIISDQAISELGLSQHSDHLIRRLVARIKHDKEEIRRLRALNRKMENNGNPKQEA